MKIYISGAITGTTDYLERFEKAEELIRESGYIPINPAKVCAGLPENSTHEEYMSVCYPLLRMADVVYMLNGWEESKGAMLEFKYAIRNKKGIHFEK